MSLVIERPAPTEAPPTHAPTPAPAPAPEPAAAKAPLTPKQVVLAVGAWVGVTLLGIVIVLTSVGPLLQEREQRALLTSFRREIRAATNESFGLPGATAPTTATDIGAPVAIIDSSDLGLRQVAVEGAMADQTLEGPGHVTGTAGPGQPGNSVIVGRRTLFGGPFSSIEDLSTGDRILVTTVQGQSVYVVGHVGNHTITDPGDEAQDTTAPETNAPVADDEGAEESKDLLPEGSVTVEELYGPSEDDRLTLVTSASTNPTSTDEATVVVATLDGLPFAPTPQGGRTTDGDGRGNDPQVLAGLMLALVAYVGVVTATVVCYRRVPWRSAYLLTAPPLVALTLVLAEQVSRLLPAWA
jgi:sortase A